MMLDNPFLNIISTCYPFTTEMISMCYYALRQALSHVLEDKVLFLFVGHLILCLS